MSATFTPGVTVTETINEDGSKTVTTVTINEDGSKSTKRKTIRPKKKVGGVSPKNSPRSSPAASPRRAAPKPSVELSMDDAFDEALAEEGVGHKDDASFEQAVRRCIPSDFLLIASQDDLSQAQEDHFASKHFDLPNPIGDAGSVATSALLQFLYQNDRFVNGSSHETKPLNCLQIVQEMHARMKKATDFVLHPQVSSSRPLGPPRLGPKQYAPFHIVPPGANGTKRALLIGIKFADDIPSKQLKGPHNDVHNVQYYLTTKCGFSPDNITVLKDDKALPSNQTPTKKNIWAGFQKLVEESKPGDVVFIQYSGHGGRVKDTSGDEADGYDSYILPSDYKTEGQILDDDILKDLIKAMPAGVHTTMLVDCCNSGTVGDLPYVLKANTQRDQEIEKFFDTDTRAEILEKEAQGIREQEDYKRAKAERKKQRELRKMQQEKAAADAKAKAATDAKKLAQRLVGLNTGSPTPPAMTMAAPAAAPTMQNFEVHSEAEVQELSRKYGVAFQLSPDQKLCLQRGGTVTLSIQMQPQQTVTMAPQMMQQTGMIMMTPEQAEAFKKANGGKLVMTPEQAAMFMKQQQGM